MRTPQALVAALVALLSLAAPAARADPSRVSAWLGRAVVDARGERIGELKDVLFDGRDGAIVALAVEYGRWLRVAEHEAAFPRGQFSRRGAALVLALPEAALRRAPALERPQWPLVRASSVIGREVRDRLHRDAGEMSDLVMDFERGEVRYALIDLPDEWGGGRLERVALDELALPRDIGQYVTLNVRRERLSGATD
jgi:sporulation protein YlmC with PRC-barrel domain